MLFYRTRTENVRGNEMKDNKEEVRVSEAPATGSANDHMSRREKVLAEKKIAPLVISFIIPTMIGMMVNAIYNIVDRFWIGKMDDGAMAMAGVGLTLPMTTIAFSFMALIGIGATALISIKLGEKKRSEAEQGLGNAASFSFIIGTIIMILGILFANPVLQLFGASGNTMPFALEYIYVIFAFNTINTIQFSMSSVMRGVGHPTWSVVTQVAGAVTNIILDPIFIFRAGNIKLMGFSFYLPFGLGMGVTGAALATGIAQTVSLLIAAYYYASGKSPVRLHVKNLIPRLKTFGRIAAIGSSSFALQCAASFVQIAANMQLAKFGGDLAISAMTLVNSIALFCIMPLIGINQGIQPIIGYNYGAGNLRRVRSTYFFAIAIASVLTISASILIQVYPDRIISLFSEDPELVRISSRGLKILMMMLPFLGFQILSSNYFQFVGKSVVSLVMTLLRQILLLLPLYFILPAFLKLDGIWYASPISDGIAILITALVISKEMIRLSRRIRQEEKSKLKLSPES